MTDPTPDIVIAKVLSLRAAKKALEDEQKKAIEPYADALKWCETWLLDYLNRNKLKNVGSEDSGLAYKTTNLSCKVENWEEFLGLFVLKPSIERALNAIEQGHSPEEVVSGLLCAPEFQFLIQGVNKTKVKEFMEATEGKTPPGVLTTQIITVGVRKAGDSSSTLTIDAKASLCSCGCSFVAWSCQFGLFSFRLSVMRGRWSRSSGFCWFFR